MTCPHCGAEVPAGNTFCTSCRKRIATPSWSGGAPAEPQRPAAPPRPPAPRGAPPIVATPAAQAGGAYCPHCGSQILPDATFCNSCGRELSGPAPGGAAAKQPGAASGMGKAAIYIVVAGVGCLVLVGVIGIIAAIAIPSLLRARVSANEAGAIGDIRTVISAEAAYASANGGYYDRIECLVQPATCIPGYSGPYMLDATFGTTPRGYRRTFHAGPAADSQALSSGKISPSSLTAFAYTAVPIQPNQTGVRSFCGDSRGIVCYALGGGPEVVNGECASACQPIN